MYDPAADTWTSTAVRTPICTTLGCLGESGVWTGSKLIVWGGSDHDNMSIAYNTGAVYDVAGNSWTTTTTTSAPSARSYHSAVWTGAKMVIFGGCNGASCGTKLNDAFEYDPGTNSWAATTTTSLPVVRSSQTAVWTGSKMIVWGGATTSAVAVNSGGAYSPQFQTYTTGSGNFTVPTGVTSVIVEVWGAGGGGGAGGLQTSPGAAGGGGGGYTRKTLTVSAGQTIAYVVGAGGAGNLLCENSAAGTTGDPSSATYSGTTYTANGGVGGESNGGGGTGLAGTGGSASNGDENRTGGTGSIKSQGRGGGGGSSASSGSNGTNAPTASTSTTAGGTPPQGGGFGGSGTRTTDAGAGVTPGGGGGGGGGGNNNSKCTGGAGASGRVSFHYSDATSAFTMSAAAGTSQATVSWTASSGATSYTVKYGTSTGTYGTTFLTSATSPTTVT